MIYAFYGLIFGFLIPYMARRFSKFMPATPGYALYHLVWPVKRVKKEKRAQSAEYQRLVRQYLMRSVGWAIVSAALSFCVYSCFDGVNVWWLLVLIWILLFLLGVEVGVNPRVVGSLGSLGVEAAVIAVFAVLGCGVLCRLLFKGERTGDG